MNGKYNFGMESDPNKMQEKLNLYIKKVEVERG